MRPGFAAMAISCLLLFPVFQFSVPSEGNLLDPGVLSDHGPVHINGDGQFSTDDSVTTGDGSAGDPYIIENWRINASTGHGIWIENTNVHLIIRNCEIFNGTVGTPTNYGIYLNNVKNGVAANNLLHNLSIGTFLWSSSSNTLSNNTVNGTVTGIYVVSGSNDNVLEDNDVHEATTGISIYFVNNATLHRNVMSDNKFNLAVDGGPSFAAFNHTMTADNTVDGKPVYYWVNRYNMPVPADAGYVGLVGCDNITAQGLSMANETPGILLFASTNVTIRDSVLSNAAIAMEGSDRVVISNNSIANLTGIKVSNSDNNTLEGNRIHNSSSTGIYIKGGSDWNLVANNVIDRSSSQGIYLYSGSVHNTIENNTIERAQQTGIFLFIGNDHTTIVNNTISDASNGIYVQLSHFADIRYNDLRNNSNCDIGLDEANWTLATNNSIHNATRGFYMRPAFNSTITNNTVWDGIYSVAVDNSWDNLFFNNYFRGGFGTWGTGTNTWNITKTLGRNIVGGPYLGGNYWNDYSGTDTDSDGLGDTNLPMYPGDYLPLIASPPNITDNSSPAVPTTGDAYTIRADAWDDSGIAFVTAEAWVDEGPHTNLTMTRYSGDAVAGNYSAMTAIPTNATTLHYFLCTKDDAVNWNCTGNMSRTIVDNDLPGMTDLTAGTPSTGENLTFNASVTDNINVSGLNVEYWYNAGPHTNDTMAVAAGTYSWNVTVASNASWMHYILKASDNSSNWAALPPVELAVTDNDLPVITDLLGTPTTGDTFTMNVSVTDNVNVSEVRINYRFDGLDPVNVTLTPSGGANFTNTSTAPADGRLFRYMLWAVDNSSNVQLTSLSSQTVGDNDAPVIKDLTGKPTTGDPLDLVANITDNVNIASVTFNYSSDDGSRGNLTISPASGEQFRMNLTVGKGARNLNYSVLALDDDGNPTTFSTSVQVKDNDAPELVPLSTNPTTGDNFTFTLGVKDNIDVATAWLEYWFDDGAHENISLHKVPGSLDNLTGNLSVPASAHVMYYTISANDTYGNWVVLKGSSMNILDNDAPVLEDLSGDPETGSDLELVAGVVDNIDISQVMVNYSFGGRGGMGDENVVFLANTGTLYKAKISVPDSATTLRYTILAIDVFANVGTTTERNINVTDMEAPFISFGTNAGPVTGLPFKVMVSATDNIGISLVWLEFWYNDEVVGGNVTMEEEGTGTGTFTFSLLIPADATTLHAMATARDAAGNDRQTVVPLQLIIGDVLAPTVSVIPGTPETGERFVMAASIDDNIAVDTVELEYWFDQGSYEVVAMTGSGGGGPDTYRAPLEVPATARSLNYIVRAYDTHDNLGSLSGNITITDIIAPEIKDRTMDPTTGERVTIALEVRDNWNVATTSIDYWFDSGAVTTIKYNGPVAIQVPDTALWMNCLVTATDTQGNVGNNSFKKKVFDNDLPIIMDLTDKDGSAKRGGKFTVRVSVTDNTELDEVQLEYWTDGPGSTIAMEEVEEGVFEAQCEVEGSGNLHYIIYAKDKNGNTGMSEGGTVPVKEEASVGMLPVWIAIMLVIAGAAMVGMFLYMRSRDREVEAQWRAQARRRAQKGGKTKTRWEEKMEREVAAAVVLPEDDEEERERKAWLARNIVFKKAARKAEEDMVRRRREARTRWEPMGDGEAEEELKALEARNIVFKKAARLAQEQVVRRNKEKKMERGGSDKEGTDGGKEGGRKVEKKRKKKRRSK